MMKYKISLIILALLVSTNLTFGSDKNSKYWIFFNDKNLSSTEKTEQFSVLSKSLSQQSLLRRAKVNGQESIVDQSDLPVSTIYINKLSLLGITPIMTSKWLNAVSAIVPAESREDLENFSFVKKIQPVVTFKRPPISYESAHKNTVSSENHSYDYGPSFDQNNIMRVPDIHDLGITGKGVIIGMLDTGYRYRNHIAFSKMNVIDEYDFINNDSNTANENSNNDVPNQDSHGTKTLSCIGGFSEGLLIGPAFGASYLLAKTEKYDSETIIEEDYWVAGLEWLEEKGADIINSSLGYNDWYSYSDLDGETAITTKAADIAVRKGVIIVNSMGNEGNYPGSIIAPADGDSVISVGAVYNNGLLTSFSSIGPTWDGRIKPDLVAQGSSIYVASPLSTTSFSYSSGTSFSSPLTAGVAALLLSAHPQLSPIEVRDVLRMTANNSRNPDNEYGWGLVNAYDAIFSKGLFYSNLPEIVDESNGYITSINIFSNYDVIPDSTFLFFKTNLSQEYNKIAMVKSSENNDKYQAILPYLSSGSEIQLYFKSADEASNVKFHPFNAPETVFTFNTNDMSINPGDPNKVPGVFKLYQNYPNPFNNYTNIKYDIFKDSYISMYIYNILGQKVRTLLKGNQDKNSYVIKWDGLDDNNELLVSGIYFVEIRAGGYLQTQKMLLLK